MALSRHYPAFFQQGLWKRIWNVSENPISQSIYKMNTFIIQA